MAILRTLGIAAQLATEIALIGIVQEAEECRPVAVFVQYLGKGRLRIVWEVVGQGVALLMAVLIAVVQL